VGDLPVLFKGFHEDKDVVQIDHDYAFQDEVLKDVINHCLEGGRTVRETKEHDKGFIQATVGLEGSLPFVSLFYLDVVEAPSDVQFCEVQWATQPFECLVHLYYPLNNLRNTKAKYLNLLLYQSPISCL